ncbi:interleukin-10 receptor subunit beta-like isoform X3 [Pyrgilauda ruficollis]|uniref:interleukin-10 receptor subunit beta-like isoform X3 n=1 Tax=Pyrgilauda ruficollis TaxID=221976 RepID=UPI001B86CF2C|nr:interleukin-10 receptor subunit beta-like isoform X3 [Pyrgilauda ruficollis]
MCHYRLGGSARVSRSCSGRCCLCFTDNCCSPEVCAYSRFYPPEVFPSSDLASGMVPEPRNVRITSVNLHSTLQWDAPRFSRGNLTYTVQSKSIYYPGDTYETLRTDLRLPQCDVSSLSPYGSYVLRLRAEAGQLHSPWVTLTFKPMDDTTIGAPEVRLRSDSGALHVDVSGPFAEHEQDRWPLRLYYGSWRYRILYWKRGSRDTDPASASQFLSKPPSAPQPFPPREELLVCDKLTVIPEQPQTLPEGPGDEGTPELPQDSAPGDSDSGVGAASGEA